MTYWILFLLELLILFLTSKSIFQSFFIFFYKILRRVEFAQIPVFLIFLPGVIIHELAHFIVAEILLVRVHSFDVSPKLENGHLRMGSVEVSKSDIVRSMLIGVAPVIVGLIVLSASLYTFFSTTNFSNILSSNYEIIKTVVVLYIVFVVTNTMFSSKKDLEGFLKFAAIFGFIILILVIALSILKVDIPYFLMLFLLENRVVEFMKFLSTILFVPVAISVIIFTLARVLGQGGLRR